MACHCLYLRDKAEFFNMMKERDSELIMKMVKCVLSATKRNKESIDIFDITFKDTSSLVFTIDKPQYRDLLIKCLDDMIGIEEYELCADMKKQIDKKTKKKKEPIQH